MKINFGKQKLIFVKDRPNHNNLLQFLQKYHISRDIQLSLRPILENQILQFFFSVLTTLLWHEFRKYGKEFQKM